METTVLTCDGCGCELKERLTFFSGDVDFCEDCIDTAMCHYLSSRDDRPLRSQCKCTDGRIRVIDDEASDAVATCGENRPVHKMVDCEECLF